VTEQITTTSTHIRARTKVASSAGTRNNRLAGLARGLSSIVGTWMARSAERRMWREVAESYDQHMLRDIGVTRHQARGAASKWFWQP